MGIKESALSVIASLTDSDFIRAVTAAGESRKIQATGVGKYAVETYSGSTLAGSAQSVQNAVNGLQSDIATLNTNLINKLKKSLIVGTASGSIASFNNGSDIFPALKCVAKIEPNQDLHGYDKPWVGGAGKNKLKYPYYDSSGSQNGITWTVNSDGTFTLSGTANAETIINISNSVTPYVIGSGTQRVVASAEASYNPNISGLNFQTDIYKDGTYTGTVQRNNSSIQITNATEIGIGQSRLRIANGTVIPNNTVFYPQIEFGQTPTAWQPYENICPISGHDEVGVSVVGKNLLAKPFSFRPVPSTLSDCFFIKKGTYTFSFDSIGTATSWRFGISLFDKNGNALTDIAYKPNVETTYNSVVGMWWWGLDQSIKQFELTIVEDCYTRIWFGSGNTDNTMTATNAMLNIGNTALPYETYNGQTHTISLGTTVYGGTLDVVSGELTVTHAMQTFNGTESWTWDSGNGLGWSIVSNGVITDGTTQHNKYTQNNLFVDKSWAGRTEADGTIGMYYGQSRIYLRYSQFTSASDIQTFLGSNNLQVVYELKTPTTYTLTAQQVDILLGDNIIFANTGPMDPVEYYADATITIQNLS